MNIIPWRQKKSEGGHENPLATLRSEMDRLFDAFTRDPLASLEWPFSRRGWGPAVDLQETDDQLIVRAEIPGIDPNEIDLSLVGNQLIIAGEKKQVSEEKSGNIAMSECCYGSFRRSLELPQSVDPDSIAAEYTQGVLTVRMKKTTAASTRHIEVKGG